MALLLLPPRTGPVRPSPGLRLPVALLMQLLQLVQLLLKLVNLLGLFLHRLQQSAEIALLPAQDMILLLLASLKYLDPPQEMIWILLLLRHGSS